MSVSRMLHAFFLSIGLSVVAGSAWAATDLEICRDNQAEAAARLTACTAVGRRRQGHRPAEGVRELVHRRFPFEEARL
jgi:hypothetical protein